MKTTSETPPVQVKKQRRKKSWLYSVLAYGTPIALASIVGGFGYFLLRGPQENLNP